MTSDKSFGEVPTYFLVFKPNDAIPKSLDKLDFFDPVTITSRKLNKQYRFIGKLAKFKKTNTQVYLFTPSPKKEQVSEKKVKLHIELTPIQITKKVTKKSKRRN